MGARLFHYTPVLCATAMILAWGTGRAQADPARNCPKLVDQSVIISKTGPTEFRLRVFDLGDGTISIFQYPLGGILEQPGPTPLDFVFVPTPDFGGTTTFTYRLTPPFGCDHGVQMGKVTLAGGLSDGTDSGLNDPPKDESNWLLDLCGAGLPLLLPFTVLSMIATAHRARS